MPPEMGDKVLNLHGTDKEILHNTVRLGVGRNDLPEKPFGKVTDLDGAHERITGNDAQHLHPFLFQKRNDQ